MGYRKKPIEIEAWKWTGNIEDMPGFLFEIMGVGVEDSELIIETLEGVMVANVGDWILQGVEGELYPCKNSVFKKTYDEIEEK